MAIKSRVSLPGFIAFYLYRRTFTAVVVIVFYIRVTRMGRLGQINDKKNLGDLPFYFLHDGIRQKNVSPVLNIDNH
jgi:hypothetical protein